MLSWKIRAAASLLLMGWLPAFGHADGHPSVHDTAAKIVERLKRTVTSTDLRTLERGNGDRLLSAEERETFATAHVRFSVNLPVMVSVFHDTKLGKEPFWLRDGSWKRREETTKAAGTTFDIWERSFEAGEIGLGVNSLKGGARHYFVTVLPETPGLLVISNLYPGALRTTNFVARAAPWADREETLESVPEGYEGQTLIQTLHARRDDAQLAGTVRLTEHPARRRPDHVVLTWSGDPRTTQAIQWRTSTQTVHAAALFIPFNDRERRSSEWQRVEGETTELKSVTTVNDPIIHRHTVELTNLRPGTRYAYRVGDGSPEMWSEAREFTTAPGEPESFAFVYMGDAQNGLDTWGRLVRGAFRARPDVAFYLMAGDLVNRGNERDDWDNFFENAESVFSRRPIVPVVGNHECQGGRPTLFLEQFALPRNGPASIEPERVYAVEYSNALLLVLDSNLAPERQTSWLEEQLRASRSLWKIVSCHHPTYSSAPDRDNKAMREAWTPLFDRYGVDLALQGHDHAYLRTHPILAGRPAGSTVQGTTYIVSVSGPKFYTQASRPETAVGFTNVSTWQVLDLQIQGARLRYRAYDRYGRLKDEFLIDKSRETAMSLHSNAATQTTPDSSPHPVGD